MRLKFLKDHGPYVAGRSYDHPHPGAATELVRRGIATEEKPEKPESRGGKSRR